jgi:hypothetical protein
MTSFIFIYINKKIFYLLEMEWTLLVTRGICVSHSKSHKIIFGEKTKRSELIVFQIIVEQDLPIHWYHNREQTMTFQVSLTVLLHRFLR